MPRIVHGGMSDDHGTAEGGNDARLRAGDSLGPGPDISPAREYDDIVMLVEEDPDRRKLG